MSMRAYRFSARHNDMRHDRSQSSITRELKRTNGVLDYDAFLAHQHFETLSHHVGRQN